MSWRPKKSPDLQAPSLALKKANKPPSPDLIELTSPEPAKVDEDSDGDEVVAELDHEHSPASSTGASGRLTPAETIHKNPSASDIKTALVNCTERRLKETPLALDFGAVKKMVEQELGLTSNFWGGKEDKWFTTSKNIIKMAVVSPSIANLTPSRLTRSLCRKNGFTEQATRLPRMPPG